MGGGISVSNNDIIRKEWLDVFKAMKLSTGEVNRLYKIFNKVDDDGSGSINVVELLTMVDIDRTAFAERIFSAFDKDHTGQVDFYEFVVCLWKFCTLGNGSLNVFAFDLYDSNADGNLTTQQVQKMFKEIFGSKAQTNENIKAVMNDLLKRTVAGELPVETFVPYSKLYQALLAPVFTIQDKLKNATLGANSWASISSRRIEVHKGYIMPIRELMVLHSNRELFSQLLEDRTVLRVSSTMRIVLENTDNACRERTPIPPSPKTKLNFRATRKARILDPNQSNKHSSKKGVVGHRRFSFDNTNTSIQEDPKSFNSRDDPKSVNSRDDPKSFNSRDSMDSQNTQVLPFSQQPNMSVRNGSSAVSHKLSAGVANLSIRGAGAENYMQQNKMLPPCNGSGGNAKPKAGNVMLPKSLLHQSNRNEGSR